MTEQYRRLDHNFDPRRVHLARLTVCQVVATSPGISVTELSEKCQDVFFLFGGELPFGPKKRWINFEQFLESMSGKRTGMLKKTGIDGTSTFEISYHGERALALSKADNKPTRAY
jgi:hypothetical protein